MKNRILLALGGLASALWFLACAEGCGPLPTISGEFGEEGLAIEGSGERVRAQVELDDSSIGVSGSGDRITATARVQCDDELQLCASIGPLGAICVPLPEKWSDKLCRRQGELNEQKAL